MGSSLVAVTEELVLMKKQVTDIPEMKDDFFVLFIFNFFKRFVGFSALALLDTKCFK